MKQVNSSTNLTMGESMLQTGHVVKDKWQVVSKIGQGAFGEVYKCKDFTSNRQVALKLVSKERVQSASHLLKLEVTVLKELQGKHYFPKFVGFGKTERFDYLVMELLGPSLSELKKHQPDRKFSLSTTLRLGHMMLKCIHSIHKAGYLHRDIKPSNFTIGTGEDNRRRVYLLDFGLARQYVLENGEVRPPRYKVSFHGTPRYASLRVLQGKEAGRQDDLMSLFYTLSEFSFRDLPWKNIRDYREMAQAKEVFDHQILVKEFPDEFQDFYNHISRLTFFDKPDYDLLYSVFDRCIKRRGVKETDPFDFEDSGTQPIEIHLRKDNNTLTDPTKSSSDVLIIDCVSFEESDKLKAKNEIKRSRSTSNNLHYLVPTSGLDGIRTEQLLRSKSSNNMMNKKAISKFVNNSKDTGFSISPFSTNSHCQPSISISIEPDYPINKPNIVSTDKGSNTKLKSQSSVESNKCLSQQTESLIMDSFSKENFTFDTKKIENLRPNLSLNKFLKKDSSLCRSPCIDTLSTLRCYKDKNKKQKNRHSVRRSVSHPASIPSHLLIKSIFHDSSKAQGQQGLPRCWSCPTISLFIRSDLKPPLKQQASFDENVYEVDVMRNVAAKQLTDEPVHVDCRRNSLPFIHTLKALTKENLISHEGNKELILNNISDSGISSLSVTRREVSDSVIPDMYRRSDSKEFEKSTVIQDDNAKVQKSFSDSNVYQKSVNNNIRVRRDSQIRKSILFNGIAPKENSLKKSTKIISFENISGVNHSNMVKNMLSLSVETANFQIHSKNESIDQYPSSAGNGQSSKFTTVERNNGTIKEESSIYEKVKDIVHFEVQHVSSDNMNRKSEINHSQCDIKDYEIINDSRDVNETIKINEKNLDILDNSVFSNTTHFQSAEDHNKINVSAEIDRKSATQVEVSEDHVTQTNVPVVYVTENYNYNSHLLEVNNQRETKNTSVSTPVIADEVVALKDNALETYLKIEEPCSQNRSRRHRANSENKYVKDESELKLHFIRRRQRPSSVVYDTRESSECSDEYDFQKLPNYSSMPSFGDSLMTGIFQNQVDSTTCDLLQPPTDDPPAGYCLPSRRRRYRRAASSLSSVS